MISVDIILPFYNGSAFIKEQIDSILKSNGLEKIHLRFIIVNDCSLKTETDYLKSILPPNSIYIENSINLGVIKSVERGLNVATADFILLSDQDDYWLPDKIWKTVQELMECPSDVPCMIFTDLMIVNNNLEKIHDSMMTYYKYKLKNAQSSIIFQNIVTGCTVGLNRSLLKIVLPFPSSVTMHDHWIACCGVYAGKVKLIKTPTILYRQHGQNQIGAPANSILKKITSFSEYFESFKKQLSIKTDMADELAVRLKEHNLLQESELIQSIANALKTTDVLFLISNRVLLGRPQRVVGATLAMWLMKRRN